MNPGIRFIKSPTIWHRSDSDEHRNPTVVQLSADQRAVLCSFELPSMVPGETFAGLYDQIYSELQSGSGICLVRGFPLDSDNSRAQERFLRFMSGLGKPQAQDEHGNQVMSIRDTGREFSGLTRGSSTSAAIGYHTDGADIAGLLCLNASGQGGASHVVGLRAAYEAMKADSPELLELLFQPWHFDRRVARGPQTSRSPILVAPDGELSVYFLGHLLRSGPLKEGMTLTPDRMDALDGFEAICARSELGYTFHMEPGEIQLLNNYTTLHARDAYVDGPGTAPRHMLRIWLRATGFRILPTGFKYGKETIEGVTYL